MKISKIVSSVVCAGLALALVACGGTGGTSTSGMARYNVTMGDAPTDSVVSFEIAVSSIVLTGAGAPVTILSTPMDIELTHLAGTVEPLTVADVPAGTYTGATITITGAEATVINSSGVPVQATVNLSQSTVNLPINLTVDGTASTLNFDLNLAQSLTVDLTANPPTVTVNPVFTAMAAANAPENEQENENGGIEDVTGAVSATTANSFTINSGQQTLTFSVNSGTSFDGVASLSALMNGMLVEVTGVSQSDGTLLATKVDVAEDSPDGLEAEGLVTSVTGNPAGSITLVVQDDVSASAGNIPQVGANVTADVSAAQYSVKSKADLTGLTFAFDGAHIASGQRVEVDAATPASDNLTANQVKLRNQGLRGTITGSIAPFGNGGSQFTLTLAPDSVFAVLTGQTTVTVYQQPGTTLVNNISVAANGNVLVRGLLFFDGTGYDMVAVRIAPPEQ